MAAPPSSDLTSVVIVLALFVWIMARRTYAVTRGTPYSGTRVFAYGALSTAIFAAFGATTIYVAVGSWGSLAVALVAPYVAVVLSAAVVATPRVERLARFERRADGRLYYRLPVIVPVISLVLFLARIGVEIGLFGLAAFATFSVPSSLSTGGLLVLISFDLLYGVSVGILLGRGLGVRRAFRHSGDAPLAAA